MTIEAMKNYIKEQDKARFVKELVNGLSMSVETAVEYVYDQLTLTNQQFYNKYFN